MSALCVLCGKREYESLFRSTDRLYRTTKERFLVVRCKHCGLLRLEPRPSARHLRAYYPPDYWFAGEASTAGRLEEAYRRVVLRDHVRFVRRAVKAAGVAGPVLDIGCGGGLFLGMMRKRGFRVVGLDISQKAAAVALRRHGVPAVCGLPDAAPLAPGSCAAVTMFHVLEHLEDPAAALRAAHALLKPGGRLVVQVPNAACWQFWLLQEWWTGVDVPRHLVDFRARDLEALAASCGFEVLRRKHFSLRDNPAGLASSIAPWLDPMARRVRRVPEGNAARLAKDLLYMGLVMAALPFTVLEAAFRAGSTVMIEARRP
jgi:SAM-dependent methyltransferase